MLDLSCFVVLTRHTSLMIHIFVPPILFNFFKIPIHLLWKKAFCSIASELWDPDTPDQCRPVLLFGTNKTHLTKNSYFAPPISFKYFKNPINFLWKTYFCSIALELWDPDSPDQCRPVLCGTNKTHLTKKSYFTPPILFEFFKNPINLLWKMAFAQ